MTSFDGRAVVVTGLGVSGFAAADALLERGARVTVVDGSETEAARERATILEVLGADVRFGEDATAVLPEGTDLVVTSPGWSPRQPLLAAAGAAGVPVWGEVELAWRIRPEGAAPWITLTGTNGKTTTVQMLAAMLSAAGQRVATVGNVGRPVIEAVMDPEPYDVLAVELSSFQLHWSSSLRPRASACLNLAPDHLDWHGSLEAYAADKARVYEQTELACVYNVQDPATEQMVRDAEVVDGCRAVGFTLGVPAVGMLGIVDDVLCDRAFVAERRTSAAELATFADLAHLWEPAAPAPHLLADALAAAALARAHGVPPVAVRDALRGFRADAHRAAVVASAEGVVWVDDSKATNPHAAGASLAGHASVVWVAGGRLKGADVDELVRANTGRLRGAVLLGEDRAVVAQALSRHAPDLPVITVDGGDTGSVEALMDRVVEAAAGLAQRGDTVLLAPAGASTDQFRDYAARGEEFAAAVARLLSRGR